MTKKRKRGNDQYKCNLCDAQCNSEQEKVIHKNSPIHSFMVWTKQTQLSCLGNAKTLSEQITETGRKEPFIGLEYIYEYAENSEGARMYECTLCESAFKSDFIFFHIVGIQHRVLYLVKHHPIMGIEADFELLQQADYRRLASNALAIEQIHGRKKINVVNEVYVSKPGIREIGDTDTEDQPDQVKGPSSSSPACSGEKLSKHTAESNPRSRDDDDDHNARSRQRERGQESRREAEDTPRFPHLNPSEDFDARALQRASSPGSQPNSKDDASKFGTGGGTKTLPDATVGSLAQPGISRVAPFQPATGGGPQPQDALEDTDVRQRNIDRGGPSAMPDRRGNRSAAGDTKDHNRRGNRSPDSRSRTQRSEPVFDESRGGDIDMRSVMPSGGISFRDLKDAYERTKQGGFGRARFSPFEMRRDKDMDSDMEVCSMEFSDYETEDFWCNEELFDFLKSYYIGDEEDVQFILEAIRIMSEALLRHKSRKEDLQKRILEEKQRLEEEKQKFLVMKKRKEDKITSMSMKSVEPENIKLFNQVTGTPATDSTGTVPGVQPSQGAVPGVQQAGQQLQGKVNPPLSGTNFNKALVPSMTPGVRPAVPNVQAMKVQQLQQAAMSQMALACAIGPLLQQLFVRPPVPANINQPQQAPGTAPVGPMLGQRPQDSENRFKQNPSRWGPVEGAGPAGPGSQMPFNQNPQTSGSRFNNPHLSNQRAPFPGQGGVRFSAPNNPNQPQQLAVQRAQAPAGRFIQNPGPRFGMRGPVDGAGTGLRPGSETRFNQNQGKPASRFGNSNPSYDQRNPVGQGAGRYAGSEMRFNQNPQPPASRFDNRNPSKEQRPMTGQGAGGYPGSQSRFNQNLQYSDSWSDNSGPQDKRQPPLGEDEDANYDYEYEYEQEQSQWNSGPQSGNQGFYNEPQRTTGMGAGRYGEQYNQDQWQSQSSRRGAYRTGMNRPPRPQGPQPTASTGFSSDRQQSGWPSQNPPKPGVYPASILKNRTGNPP